MTRFIFLTIAFLIVSLILVPQFANAYDIDTHFYNTYSMARYAGINHDTALFLATADQWADESTLTSPLQLPDPINPIADIEFLRKQRFVHFACPLRGESNLGKISSISLSMVSQNLNDLTCQVSGSGNDPFASELFMTGLKNSDLLIAGAGLHTIQDSYAHAGYPNHVGHAAHGHWPDRPFARTGFYNNMVYTFFSALVAIRTLLPENAIDKTIVLTGMGKPNWQLGFDDLASSYLARADVKQARDFNPLRESEDYGNKAFAAVLKSAVQKGFVTQEALDPKYTRENIVWIAQTRMNKCDVLPNKMIEIWVDDALKLAKDGGPNAPKLINKEKVFDIIFEGYPRDPNGNLTREVLNKVGFQAVVHKSVEFFTDNLIPRTPTGIQDIDLRECEYHPVEIESEGIHDIELGIRVDKYKELIAGLYHINLDFNKRKFLDRMPKQDQLHWEKFFNALIKDGTYKFLFSNIANYLESLDGPLTGYIADYVYAYDKVISLFTKITKLDTQDNLHFHADNDVLYYQFVTSFNKMIADKEASDHGHHWLLASPSRIEEIIKLNADKGYSEDSLKAQAAGLK